MQKELLKSETNRVEFKQQLTDDIEKEIIAFLNYRERGLLYLGVDDESNILGVKNSDHVMLQIKDRLKHNIMPSCMGLFDIISEEYEGKDIIKIIVASGPEKPYYLKKYGMSERGALEHLGSGIPRILESYGKECFKFSDNFLRITFPISVTPPVAPPVTPPVELLELVNIVSGEMSRKEIQNELRLADKMHFLSHYLQPAIQLGLLEMTIPEKPNSRLQKYRLTQKGITLKQNDL